MKKENRRPSTETKQRGRLLKLKRENLRDLSTEQLSEVAGGGSCYNPPAEF